MLRWICKDTMETKALKSHVMVSNPAKRMALLYHLQVNSREAKFIEVEGRVMGKAVGEGNRMMLVKGHKISDV